MEGASCTVIIHYGKMLLIKLMDMRIFNALAFRKIPELKLQLLI